MATIVEMRALKTAMESGLPLLLLTPLHAATGVTVCALGGAAGCAISSILRCGPERRWKKLGPAIAAGLSLFMGALVFAAVLIWYQIAWSTTWGGWLIVMPLLFVGSGLSIAFSGLCFTEDPQENDRLASDRWTVALLGALAVVAATSSMALHESIHWLRQGSLFSHDIPSLSEDPATMELALWLLWPHHYFAAAALVGLASLSLVVLLRSPGRPFSRRVLLDGVRCMLILAPAAIVAVVLALSTLSFFDTADAYRQDTLQEIED